MELSRSIAYGVTTVAKRYVVLSHTLASLARAGFPEPVILHDVRGNAMAHWASMLVYLWTTQPKATLYAIFQDDLLAVKGLRHIINAVPSSFLEGHYLNLYTEPRNERIIAGKGREPRQGWHLSNQLGKGALGLVFSREVVLKLLTAESFWLKHAAELKHDRSIDGCVVTALALKGIKETVHWPSLLQHTGTGKVTSAIGNKAKSLSESFPGEDWLG